MTGKGLAQIVAAALALSASAAQAASPAQAPGASGSGWGGVVRVLTLQDYNTRVVVLGTGLLGLAAGIVGTFLLLRKRALLGDALSHATLPGIALAFLLAVLAGASGKSLGILLAGAVTTGVLGVGTILFLRHYTRLKEDTALGVVLSVFFGAGVALLGVVQKMQTGHAAGLESFIYGKTASMISSDALLIGVSGLLATLVCVLLYKEFKIVCFDAGFAGSQGWPVIALDIVMMVLVVAVTVIGLQAVGRFWTDRMHWMIVTAGLVGGAGAMLGAAVSALAPRLPSGAMIVMTVTAVFLASMCLGTRRGILPRWLAQRRLARRIARQNLLRALYEWSEEHVPSGPSVTASEAARHPPMPTDALLAERSWSPMQLRQQLRAAQREGCVVPEGENGWRLTPQGLGEAQRLVRNHRLWETFLIHFADVAPSHVDRDADAIEHVLSPEMIRQLEDLLDAVPRAGQVPDSPHPVAVSRAGSARGRT